MVLVQVLFRSQYCMMKLSTEDHQQHALHLVNPLLALIRKKKLCFIIFLSIKCTVVDTIAYDTKNENKNQNEQWWLMKAITTYMA